MRLVIDGCAVATADDTGTEHAVGHIVVQDGRITAVEAGRAPAQTREHALVLNGTGCLATPGLVNCHHHMYQSATRGYATDHTLFEWLVALYPVWEHIGADTVAAAARAALAALARSGCSLSTDHHYIFPRDGGDLLATEIEAAASIGLRFHPCRGAMDLGVSQGGLPPDSIVEDRDAALQAMSDAVDRFHDPSPDAMTRVALAPTSPFSVTTELLRETAELARRRGVRLHTHLAETDDEEDFCLERFGVRPLEFLEGVGWTGDDVWFAHCCHLDADECRRMGASGTGVAHCPTSNGRLGAGVAPVRRLLDAGAPVGLGVDGAASNESGELTDELRGALLVARAHGGPRALDAREALALATRHGARCLGRQDELGQLAPGMLADVALWRLDGPDRAGVADPVAALVLGPPRPVDTLIVGGRLVVSDGELRTADPFTLAADLSRESEKLWERAPAGARAAALRRGA